ncbi:MAG: hypothetical protein EOP47_18660, partial [Sphingobacteriaceae bacterium]
MKNKYIFNTILVFLLNAVSYCAFAQTFTIKGTVSYSNDAAAGTTVCGRIAVMLTRAATRSRAIWCRFKKEVPVTPNSARL